MVLTSVQPGPAGFLVSEAEAYRSREQIVVANGEDLKAGHVIGRIASGGAVSAAKAGGNTGGGTITANPTLEAGVQEGIYRIRCIGGTFSASRTADASNTGNGVMTLASPAFGNGVVAGTYRVVCTTAQADAGVFTVFSPSGAVVGQHTVGGAGFDDVVKFSIADGVADFIVGDAFSIVVVNAVPANGGVFSVTTPGGVALENATEGAAYSSEIGFQIDDVGADFIVGDGFDVTVTLVPYKWKEYNPANNDGSETPAGILWSAVDATGGDVVATAVVRDCQVNANELTWFSGATTQQKDTAIQALASTHGIVARVAV